MNVTMTKWYKTLIQSQKYYQKQDIHEQSTYS